MTITSLSTSYFHAMLPEVTITTSAESIQVTITLGATQIYKEVLWAVGGQVKLSDLGDLVEPWLYDILTETMTISCMELDSDGAGTGVTASASCTLVYGNVDMDIDCSSFCQKHFLSVLTGTKTTAEGRLEYLHYTGEGSPSCTAYYSDGTSASFTPQTVAGNGKFTTLDVSPDNFETSGKTLVRYVVSVGDRTQEYEMDMQKPDCAPVMLFTNSFGCQELAYCRGKHEVKPDYTRSSAYISGLKKNYHIKEERKFTADTGVLNVAEQNWIDDMFRSREIYVVNFVGGTPRVGRQVIITGSKSEFSNEWDALNRATFTYQYSQKCHNVIDATRVGRIFDNTFDNTFD